MQGLINYQNAGLPGELAARPENGNMLWGTEYILADGPGFMGQRDGAAYDTVIDMFIKIRHTQKSRRVAGAVFGLDG